MPISERDLHPYIKALVEEYGELTVTELDEMLREILTLDEEDLAPIRNRADDKFSQTVRNVVSHAPGGVSQRFGYIIDKTTSPTSFFAIAPERFSEQDASTKKIDPDEISRRKARKRSFNARKIDFHALNLEKSELGSLGEQFALEWERRRLLELEVTFQVAEEVIHVSRKHGDGSGYDILSRDEHFQPIYIEVKTTTANFNSPFYMSENEKVFLEENDNVKIYRVYRFNKEENTGHIRIITKEELLRDYKFDPISYKVSPK